MPRKARKKSSTGIYHVIMRGNDRDFLFFEDADYLHFRELTHTGHVFEKRFYSAPVETRAYFDACLNYIIHNPVEAGAVADPKDYPWLWVREDVQTDSCG